MSLIVCPECKTEYEKEAKYCYKCRIAFSDDIPESISKYLKRNASLDKINSTGTRTTTENKPPLARNTSVGGIKSANSSNSNNIQISSTPINTTPFTSSSANSTPLGTTGSGSHGDLTRLIHSSGSPPPSTSTIPQTALSTGSVGNPTIRPRQASSPTPPTHPLPPTPSRASVPVGTTITSAKPPTPTPSPSHNTNNHNSATGRTVSPVNTSPSTDFTSISSPSATENVSSTPSTTTSLKRPLSMRIPPPPPTKKQAQAIWDCVPEQPGDLKFHKGDIITIVTKDHESGWWVGSINGEQGLFPSNYVKEIE